mgnify:FL=1
MTREPEERLASPDDMATRREEQFLQAALAAHRPGPGAPKGRCANCGASCMPLAVYCDPDCRADHEERLAAAARRGDAR